MKRLPLHDRHADRGAKFGEFAGFEMPLYYGKPIEEHHAVRESAGVFDISHMGQFVLEGSGAEALLRYALTNDVFAMADGDALYSPLCKEDGGVLDDLIIYRYSATRYRIIVNAATREKDLAWLRAIAEEYRCTLADISAGWGLLAVQGPQAFERLGAHLEQPAHTLKYYGFTETRAFGMTAFVARTGYTGEPGCELAVPVQRIHELWDRLTGDARCTPIGLAARDTLRLEAALPLYGHELRETWNPLECGLAWAVTLEGPDEFIGRKALLAVRGVGFPYRLAGLEVTGRGIPREGYPVLSNGDPVGVVTSGALSPTTGKAIGLARIRREHCAVGTQLAVEIRGKAVGAQVVRRPFYRSPALRA